MPAPKEKTQNSPWITDQVELARASVDGVYEKMAHLPGCFLHKPLVSDPEGPAQGLSRIMGEHLLAY